MGRRQMKPEDVQVDLTKVEDLQVRWQRLEEEAVEREFDYRIRGLIRDLNAGTPWSEGWDET